MDKLNENEIELFCNVKDSKNIDELRYNFKQLESYIYKLFYEMIQDDKIWNDSGV